MAKTSQVAQKAAGSPTREQLARVEEWTREPLGYDEQLLRPGTGVRRAIDSTARRSR